MCVRFLFQTEETLFAALRTTYTLRQILP